MNETLDTNEYISILSTEDFIQASQDKLRSAFGSIAESKSDFNEGNIKLGLVKIESAI